MPRTIAGSVLIDVRTEEAWAFLSDPHRAHSLAAQSTVTPLSGSYDTVGSRYLVTTRVMGQTLDATHEIIRYEPPRLLETRITSQGTVSTNLVQVEPVRDDACVVVIQGEIEWGGSFQAIVSRIMTALVGRKTIAGYLDRLKRAIEDDARNRSAVLADREPHLAEEG